MKFWDWGPATTPYFKIGISKLVFQNCSSKKRGFFQKLDYVGLSFWVAVTIHTETTPVGTILDCRTSRSDSESKTDIVMTQH